MRKKEVLKNDEYGALLQILFLLMVIVVASYAMNVMQLFDSITNMLSIVIIGIVSVLIVIQICSFSLTEQQRLLLMSGYMVRIIVMLIDIFAADKVTIFHSGDDALGFWKASSELYVNGESSISSNYAKALNGLYHIFGANRVLAQYVNILCFVGTVIVVLLVCKISQVPQKYKTYVILYLCFLPNYICISSILLRESMMIFFNTLGMFFFLLWMQSDKLRYLLLAFIAIAPAVILHSGAIGIWLAFLLVGLFWNAKRQRIGMTWKTGLLLGMTFGALIVIEAVPSLRQLLMQYLPTEFTIQTITGKYFEPGGSDYLMNLEVTTWGGVAYWTVIRVIYFVLAPMPMDWRGISDIGAFVIDSIPTLILLGGIVTGLRHNNKKIYTYACLLACLCVCGVFAWGTSNAGTAMRHRSILVGVYAIAYCICKGDKKLERNC